MPWLVQSESGTPPRDSVVSGNTDTSTGVTASKPHSCTSRHRAMASSAVDRGKPGGAVSAGAFTVHGKSAPARSATASRIKRRTRARFSNEPPNSSVRRL